MVNLIISIKKKKKKKLKEDNVPLFSIVLREFNKKLLEKELTSSFHGFKDQLFLMFVSAHAELKHKLEQKVSYFFIILIFFKKKFSFEIKYILKK